MPGPVSDSYDPEWGTRQNAEQLQDAIGKLYGRVTAILGGVPPVDIRVLHAEENVRTRPINATLSEWEWRILRFACERAEESI